MRGIEPPLDIELPDPRRKEAVPAGGMALVLLECLTDPVYVIDGDWRITFCNPAYANYMSMPEEALLGRPLWDTIPPGNRPRLEGVYQRVMRSGVAEQFIHESVVYPGRSVDVRVFPMFDGVAVVFRDVTRRVAAEQALAVSEAHLRRALAGAHMGDWAWDARSDHMTFSQQAMELYGLGPEGQGMTREELRRLLLHPDDVAAVRLAAQDAHARQQQYDVEYRVRRGGGWRWMRVMGGPQVVDGEIVGMHGLVQDIHDRKLASERLKAEIEERERGQQRQTLLIHELNHRVKNILAMVQAIATQTLSTAVTPEAARQALEQRLLALAGAHDVLTRESWDGAELLDIITGAVQAHESRPGDRFRTKGPRVRLEPKTAVSLAMALHELATNAVKYGALSAEAGWIDIVWTVAPVQGGIDLRLEWSEHGGPETRPPARTGFGTRLILRSLAAEQGSAELAYPPEGCRCRIAVALPLLTGGSEMRLV
jgi:PAS domain S-box-containing protein